MADAQVQEVKDKIDIVQIVSERVDLKRSGRNFKAVCPFHAEKTPSFYVSAEMQYYKCFGCGAAGDVISFMQQYEGLTFPEALEQLAKRAGVKLTRSFGGVEDKTRDRQYAVLALAKEYYHYLLTEHEVGKVAREYLWGRKISPSLIEEFSIGYALENWEGVLSYLTKKKGYRVEEVEAVGLAIPGNRGRYDRFRGRVMFPLHDYQGRVVGFSGRVLDPDVKEAKYINSPETALYHKRELLYGMHLAKQHIRSADRVVIVEGEMDVIGSRRAGIKEVVAIKGSALTAEQIGLIRRLTRNVVLALDADEAGQEAMLKGMRLLEEEEMNLRVVDLSGGKDPDELTRESPASWKEQVNKALSVYAFYLQLAERTYDLSSGQGIKEASRFLAPVMAAIENAVEQAHYVNKAARLLSVSEEAFRQEMRKVEVGESAKSTPSSGQAEALHESRRSRREILERYVLALAVQFEGRVGEKLGQLEADWFSESYMQQLVAEVLGIDGIESMGLEELRQHVSSARMELLHELYVSDVELVETPLAELGELYEQSMADLKHLHARERVSWLNRQLASDELTDEQLELYRAELAKLRQAGAS